MSWNHRVIRHTDQRTGEVYYTIHEVFYDANGRAWACTEQPIPAYGETVQDLAEELLLFLDACHKPVMDYDSIPEPGAIHPHDDRE